MASRRARHSGSGTRLSISNRDTSPEFYGEVISTSTRNYLLCTGAGTVLV